MDREQRRMRNKRGQVSLKSKYIIYWLAILGIVAIILLSYALNSKEAKSKETKQSNISNLIIADSDTNTESASSTIGNTLDETIENNNIQNETTTNTDVNSTNNTEKKDTTIKNNSSNTATNTSTNATEKANPEKTVESKNKVKEEKTNTGDSKSKNEIKEEKTNTENSESKVETNSKVVKKEVTFSKPVEGSILKEFAKDNLVYSETLKEWVTHNGVDISAEKTTVVKAATDGTVKAIKNDPRYGLTVIMTHNDGFETVYSNLLTAEFIVEGETLSAGQSIGTVGNSASFESCDESHLHFEMLKNGEYVDPCIYIKY